MKSSDTSPKIFKSRSKWSLNKLQKSSDSTQLQNKVAQFSTLRTHRRKSMLYTQSKSYFFSFYCGLFYFIFITKEPILNQKLYKEARECDP